MGIRISTFIITYCWVFYSSQLSQGLIEPTPWALLDLQLLIVSWLCCSSKWSGECSDNLARGVTTVHLGGVTVLGTPSGAIPTGDSSDAKVTSEDLENVLCSKVTMHGACRVVLPMNFVGSSFQTYWPQF